MYNRIKIENVFLEIHINEHCNLKCSNCCHFSPIADKEFLDINEYESNLSKIPLLNHFKYITLLGGEPLLNDKICDIIRITRKYYTKTLRIITNGLLLEHMSKEFFYTCIINNVHIMISKYPINLDYDKIISDLKQKYKGLNIYYYRIDTYFYKHKFDLEGKQNIIKNFKTCWVNNLSRCVQLVGTKLYICTYSAYIRHFNKRFNTNLVSNNYLDLSKITAVEVINTWLNIPKDFCKYCILENNENILSWQPYKNGVNDYL